MHHRRRQDRIGGPLRWEVGAAYQNRSEASDGGAQVEEGPVASRGDLPQRHIATRHSPHLSPQR